MINLLKIERKFNKGKKLSRKEAKAVMGYSEKHYRHSSNFPIDISAKQLDIFEAQAKTMARSS